ncbi:hypothetical protein [Bacillus sp. AFS017336]|uniref:hypothetical protein n=1 Tax=Bacillus sp. AFS017336 TaxID=2033489 RepID=UPI000BEF62FB|nr:hypothetical protein [Bacillus sp. AFS017336]PEL03300.1 hypothetical protein CN601_22005 [Bacillus sp. AFS017336]
MRLTLNITLPLLMSALGIYCFITGNFTILPYTLSLLGVFSLIQSYLAFKEKRKLSGFLCILFSILLILSIFN